MSTFFYSINTEQGELSPVAQKSMAELNFSEPYDLEKWLSSLGEGLFNRKILWLARQDYLPGDQRSDLIGVDKLGNLLIAELKRGELNEHAITQALSYAAEYANKSADDLADLLFNHSQKEGATKLVSSTNSFENAQTVLSEHVGAETEVNESQILLLVGESFTAKALAICDYLNSSNAVTFSVECWRYGIFRPADDSHYLVIEQILPPPSVRQAIEQQREKMRAKKYALDPVRREFMNKLVAYLWGKEINARRSQGQSYGCRFESSYWKEDHEPIFSVHEGHPKIVLPPELRFEGDLEEHSVTEGEYWDGRRTLEFRDIDVGSMTFLPEFGERLIKVLECLKANEASLLPSAEATETDSISQRNNE